MAIIFTPRKDCFGLGDAIKSIFLDLLICMLNIASCIMLFFIEPLTIGQIVFVIMVTIITFATYVLDIATSDGCERMLQIQKTMTLSTFISVILWICPISVFWSLIPLLLGVINSHLIACEDLDDLDFIPVGISTAIAMAGMITFIVYTNMYI